MSHSSRGLVASAYVAFAAFGAFWGVWGASVPRVQDQAGVSDGELGLALLFVGAGALPAMLLVGRALDRWGLPVAALVISLPRRRRCRPGADRDEPAQPERRTGGRRRDQRRGRRSR